MIIRKTPREIALLKEAGRIVALVHQELKKSIVSGITTKEIDKLSEQLHLLKAIKAFLELFVCPLMIW